jgi:hypothetical protein
MTNRVHRPFKVKAFNANGISRQRYELWKQLQDLHIDVALFSETHLKTYELFSLQNYLFYRIDRHPERKGRTVIAVRKAIPHSHLDLISLISIEATGIYIPTGTKEILLPSVYKSPWGTWSDADIVEILRLKHKCILASDCCRCLIQAISKFLPHSAQPLLPCRKLRCTGHCDKLDYQKFRCHCVWYSGFRSLTNHIPHPGSI